MLLALGGGWDGVYCNFSTLGEDWGEAFVGFLVFYFAPFQPAMDRCGAEIGVGYP